MNRMGLIIIAGVFPFLIAASSPQNVQKHGNAEVRHQQYIMEQLNKPSTMEIIADFLTSDENIQFLVEQVVHAAIREDRTWTMECSMIADGREVTCCRLTDSGEGNEHKDHH